MTKWPRALLCGAALAALPTVSNAQSSKSFDVCGGSFPGSSIMAMCASANVAVSNVNDIPTVMIRLWNLSGANLMDTGYESVTWSNIIGIGLTNIIPQSVDMVENTLKVTGPCSTNPGGCDYSEYWWASNDVGLGGLTIDMFAMDARGGGVVSNCDPNNPLITRDSYFTTDCNKYSPNFVTMTFAVTQLFDLNTSGDIYMKAMYMGDKAMCISGDPQPGQTASTCVPMTSAPEPGTLALLGSGLASFGGFGAFRRRRKKGVDA